MSRIASFCSKLILTQKFSSNLAGSHLVAALTPGESVQQAAIRELAEETGLRVTAEQLGEQIWQTEGIWRWGDGINQHSYVDYFFQLRVDDFELDDSNWTDDERRDVLEHRWWSVAELIESGESVGPLGLVEFLKHHLI